LKATVKDTWFCWYK